MITLHSLFILVPLYWSPVSSVKTCRPTLYPYKINVTFALDILNLTVDMSVSGRFVSPEDY